MEQDPKHLAGLSERMTPRKLRTEKFGLHGMFRSGSWVLRLTFYGNQASIQQNDLFGKQLIVFIVIDDSIFR
jgi:hypothetical protein